MSHPLLERLTDADATTRREACAAIAADPAAIVLASFLSEALSDADAGVRRAAADALVRLAHTHPEVDPLLRDALRGESADGRFEAARALAELSPPAPRLIPALVEGLGHASPATAWEAARLLVQTGRLHAEVIAIVTGLVSAGESAALRRMAVFCLRELAPERPETEVALLEATIAEDVSLRCAALSALPALVRCGAPARALQARLAEAARTDADPNVRALAARAQALCREAPHP